MLKKFFVFSFAISTLLLLHLVSSYAAVTPKTEGDTAWYDATQWEPEGRGWSDTLRYFDRLPAKAEKTVRQPVWWLSRDSSGMLVRFATDANQIDVHYKLHKGNLSMHHMPSTGVSGVDLYVKHDGQWRWLGVSRPASQDVKVNLVKDIPSGRREYMLYLPLYNGVDSLEIGVPKTASFEPIAPQKKKPIVYYGTSIAQGGCASRPGMAHTSIISRKLDNPVINLGFSGNGTMDASIGELMGELDAAVYVIDCLPNMDPKGTAAKTEPLIKQLREARPEVPIVMVEDPTYSHAFLVKHFHDTVAGDRAAFKKAYEKMQAEGVKGLYYVEGEQLFGSDGEATVDGVHPTDLGMQRQADVLIPVLRPLLKK